MKNNRKKKKRYVKWIVLLVVVCLLAGAGSVITVVFSAKQIEYSGSTRYDSEQLTQSIFGNSNPNTLLYTLFSKNKQESIPFVQKYDVEIIWPDKMQVTVYEKPVIGYVSYMGCNMYFDKDGIVVESSTQILDEVPQITGLVFKSIVLDSKLDVGNDDVFNRILELTQGFDKYEIIVDRIYFDSTSDVTVFIGDVKVLLGNADNMTDKLYELKQMSAQFGDLKGTLHLEDYTKDSKSVIFQKEK